MYATQGTLIDPAARQKLVWQMQQYLYNARPYIILDYPDVIEAYSKSWTGFTISPVMGSVNSLSMQTLLQVHRG
jgi:peptide/nickel transport system substrate-binding protein